MTGQTFVTAGRVGGVAVFTLAVKPRNALPPQMADEATVRQRSTTPPGFHEAPAATLGLASARD
jgi:hypothetical protein